MILRAFPDITWLKKQISEDFSQWKGSENVVRNQKSWPTVVLNVKIIAQLFSLLPSDPPYLKHSLL